MPASPREPVDGQRNPRRPAVCSYEGSDYQERFWVQGKRDYEDQVEAIALRRLLPGGGRLLLEAGAGAGRNTLRYKGFERVVLLDYSLSQLEQAQTRLGREARYCYVAADIYRLPFVDGLFDAATMIRVFHHMAQPPAALRELRRVLQPRALFILEYANKQNLKAILRWVLRRQSWNPFSLEPVEFAELNYDFHPRQVRSWLRDSNFALQRQLTVSHFRIEALKRLVPIPLLVGLDALAQWSGDWWQLSPSVFSLSRAFGNTPQAPAGAFFCCPECQHAPLEAADQALICPQCSHPWSIRDGIYDFRS